MSDEKPADKPATDTRQHPATDAEQMQQANAADPGAVAAKQGAAKTVQEPKVGDAKAGATTVPPVVKK